MPYYVTEIFVLLINFMSEINIKNWIHLDKFLEQQLWETSFELLTAPSYVGCGAGDRSKSETKIWSWPISTLQSIYVHKWTLVLWKAILLLFFFPKLRMSKFCHVLCLACPSKPKISNSKKNPKPKTKPKSTQENPHLVKVEQKCNVLAHVYKKRGNDTILRSVLSI